MRPTLCTILLIVTTFPTLGTAADPPTNVLSLDVAAASLFVRPGEPVLIELNVSNLAQSVNGCQALIGFNSGYLVAPHSVVPGGGYWTELIYENWNVPGELDAAIGVQLEGGPAGTSSDGTVAFISLTAGMTQGVTNVAFRADVDNKYATMLSGLDAEPVWPNRIDSHQIIIDGTAPALQVWHAEQGGNELLDSLGSTANAVQGAVDIRLLASDPLAGLASTPVLTVRDSANANLPVTFVDENPPGVFNYTAQISSTTANGQATVIAITSDNAGNTSIDHDTFRINKNQITGTIEFDTASSQNYTVNRPVLFTATNSAGTVLRQWSTAVQFVNVPASQSAAGTFVLADVPAGTVRLSAKTAWSLRRRIALSWDSYNQAVANYTLAAGTHLRSGDITNDNVINLPDYITLRANWFSFSVVADINGDRPVQTLDYVVLNSNWFTMGDPP